MNIVMEAGEVGEGFQAWVFLFVGSFSSHTQGSVRRRELMYGESKQAEGLRNRLR